MPGNEGVIGEVLNAVLPVQFKFHEKILQPFFDNKREVFSFMVKIPAPDIMKSLRKSQRCLNCYHTLDVVYNYCPNCGQENNDNNVRFSTLLGDFFSNYFSLDSKLARTVKPFVLWPGFLTNRFIEGKRVRYMHPLRLYLIVSLLFFTFFSIYLSSQISEDFRLVNMYDPDKVGVGDAEENFAGIQVQISKSEEEEDKVFADSLTAADPAGTGNVEDTTYEEFLGLTTDILDRMGRLARDYNLPEDAVMDSLQLEKGSTKRMVARQLLRLTRAEQMSLAGYVVKNIPIMMFILMPIFALLLKLVYVRRKHFLYIQHLIHALHLHSFMFFLFAIGIGILFAVPEGYATEILLGLTFIVFVYVYISFKRVYNQGWVKTFFKYLLVGYFYLMLFITALSIELLISLALY